MTTLISIIRELSKAFTWLLQKRKEKSKERFEKLHNVIFEEIRTINTHTLSTFRYLLILLNYFIEKGNYPAEKIRVFIAAYLAIQRIVTIALRLRILAYPFAYIMARMKGEELDFVKYITGFVESIKYEKETIHTYIIRFASETEDIIQIRDEIEFRIQLVEESWENLCKTHATLWYKTYK